MEITNIEKTTSGTYYTVKVTNKLIKIDELFGILDNISDYQDKYGKYDIDLIKEEILKERTYVVKVSDNETTCTCKNSLFRKTDCRHITFIREWISNNKNEKPNL